MDTGVGTADTLSGDRHPQVSGSAAEVLDSAAGRGKDLPQALAAPAFVLSAMAELPREAQLK
ncbi:hypothetical protein [Paractinoplanes hotanensis]|uniref:Uncharacterized protein n=1 Tax=Paractinoplanes hotanensis TaxID=2906497 RepID=A0ABT0YFJ3_9ACTN|nr:hypothetical protein [Actinoplanes hotanensis]MCM4084287.1 hypothetical protein [Actinoplanes hotanensis]